MKKLRAIIIEDEQISLDGLVRNLKKHCDELVDLVEPYAFTSPAAFINKQADLTFNLLFLDIQFDEERTLAFDLLNSIENKNFFVIYVTAHLKKYAYQSLKQKFITVDYLEKPYTAAALVKAVKNAYYKLVDSSLPPPPPPPPMKMFVYKFVEKTKTTEGVSIDIEDIEYIEANNMDQFIHLKNVPIIYVPRQRSTMQDLKQELTSKFIFVNRGSIINGECIDHIDTSKWIVVMKNSRKPLSVSETYRKDLLSYMGINK